MAQSPRCMRGLHFIYSLTPAPPTGPLAAALAERWPEPMRRVEEPWPGGCVVRFTVPHVLELRVGERPGEISLYHRSRTPPDVRALAHRCLAEILDELEARDEPLPGL